MGHRHSMTQMELSLKDQTRHIVPHAYPLDYRYIFIDNVPEVVYFSAIKVSPGHNRESC